MGLLDDFTQFIKTPEGQGIASAIAGYAANARRGTIINNLGRGGMAGLLGYSNALDRQSQEAENAQMREYRTMQMDQLKRQGEAARRRQEFLERIFPMGAGDSADASIPGTVPGTEPSAVQGENTLPPLSVVFKPEENARRANLAEQSRNTPPAQGTAGPATSQAPANGGLLRQMTPDQVAALKLYADMDVTDVWKAARPNWQVNNGYAVDTNSPTFQGGYLPGISTSNDGKVTFTTIGPDGRPVVSAAPGSVETFSRFEDEKNAANARYRIVKVWNPLTQREEYLSEEQVAQMSRGGQPQGNTTPRGGNRTPIGGGQNLSPALQELIRRDAEANGITNPTTNFTGAGPRQMYSVTPTGTNQPVFGATGTTPPQTGQGFAAGPSVTERASSDAFGKVNDSWLKNSFEPTVSAGSAASQTLASIEAARSVLKNLGKTGWGTETRAYFASVLEGLGVASKNASMYASNVQQFQNIAMTNLKTALDAASGPQTEGDAERGAKLFAQLQNTPEANSFILDLAEAKAQRDAMKARFYQEALPIARSRGDLQEVDREWQRRAPSIFDMPSMKNWRGQK